MVLRSRSRERHIVGGRRAEVGQVGIIAWRSRRGKGGAIYAAGGLTSAVVRGGTDGAKIVSVSDT